MWDLDHFKKINDNHGHLVGDKVPGQVCEAAKAVIRKHDVMARVGGEEFCVLLPNASEKEGIGVIQRMQLAIKSAKIKLENNRSVSVTASFGLAVVNKAQGVNDVAIYKLADEALYQAKANGRNCCEIKHIKNV